MMINPKILDEITQQLVNVIPPAVLNLNENIQKNLRAAVSSIFEKFDLVTRDEFDAQLRVLHRALDKLAILEQKIAELSEQTYGKGE